jgi:N-formylglutamate amidohydrolase
MNDPFAGGHVVDRHARPLDGVHAIQIEVDRSFYLDERLQKPGKGFDRVSMLLESLAVELGQELLGRQYATAAE